MSDKPINHAPDHRWWGAARLLATGTSAGTQPAVLAHDPISPDPFIVVTRLDSNVAHQIPSDSAPHTIDLDPGISGVAWGTNAPEIFDIGTSGGIHVVEMQANLFYEVDLWISATISGTAAASATAQGGITGSNFTIGGQDCSLWVIAPGSTDSSVQVSRRGYFNLPAAYGTPPFITSPTLAQNSGATTTLFQLALKITARHMGDPDF